MRDRPGALHLVARDGRDAAIDLPTVTAFDDDVEEARGVAGRIVQQIAAGIDPRRIAVLYRAHSQSAELLAALADVGIAATVLGSGIAFLDGTVVNVALPTIGEDLGAGLSGLQWILDSYLVTLSALLLLGGSLGDIYGRRKVFIVGLVAFTVASVLCGLAPSTGFLIEMARSLKQAPPPMPVELLFLDGEEAVRLEWRDPDNRYGSRYYVEQAKKDGTLSTIAALILVDMIGDADLAIKRESQSTARLAGLIWGTASALGRREFLEEATPIEDDHIPFLEAGVPAVDIIDLDYPAWHTPEDTMDKLSARSFQAVGDVVLTSLPAIAKWVSAPAR
jgi:hypothetical protein